jgi:hypothetical protein
MKETDGTFFSPFFTLSVANYDAGLLCNQSFLRPIYLLPHLSRRLKDAVDQCMG